MASQTIPPRWSMLGAIDWSDAHDPQLAKTESFRHRHRNARLHGGTAFDGVGVSANRLRPGARQGLAMPQVIVLHDLHQG